MERGRAVQNQYFEQKLIGLLEMESSEFGTKEQESVYSVRRTVEHQDTGCIRRELLMEFVGSLEQ